jgi:hypothetical protein
MPRVLARALALTAGSRVPLHAGSSGPEGSRGCGGGGLIVVVRHVDESTFVGSARIAFRTMAAGENGSESVCLRSILSWKTVAQSPKEVEGLPRCSPDPPVGSR